LEDNQSFAKKLGAKYVLLSDPDKKTAKDFGILMGPGFSRRVTIYVDKQGIVQFIDEKVNVRNHGKDIAAKVKELKLAE
jgi:peroxiredoxin